MNFSESSSLEKLMILLRYTFYDKNQKSRYRILSILKYLQSRPVNAPIRHFCQSYSCLIIKSLDLFEWPWIKKQNLSIVTQFAPFISTQIYSEYPEYIAFKVFSFILKALKAHLKLKFVYICIIQSLKCLTQIFHNTEYINSFT